MWCKTETSLISCSLFKPREKRNFGRQASLDVKEKLDHVPAEREGRTVLAESTTGDLLNKSKVYIVPFIQPSQQAPEGFTELFEAYWNAVDRQVSGLEAKAGVVKRIFAEGVLGKGDDALLMLEQTNRPAWSMIKARVDAGARFDEYEDTDLFGQVIDWSRCLSVGLISQTVADTITKSYQEAAQARQAHLDKKLSEGLQAGEAALVLSGTTDLKLPEGVERFLISPPELDALERWIRQVNAAARQAADEAEARARSGQRPPQQEPPQQSGSSGLWTPGS